MKKYYANKKLLSNLSSNTGRILSSINYDPKTSIYPEEPMNMSDEELYYIASVIGELSSVFVQRSIFESLHKNCDDDTVVRFYEFFKEEEINKIMVSC
tara:strand:+ start:185 stop:478 length:294 start_codon:yes stop_codon:yes gene_type:complete